MPGSLQGNLASLNFRPGTIVQITGISFPTFFLRFGWAKTSSRKSRVQKHFGRLSGRDRNVSGRGTSGQGWGDLIRQVVDLTKLEHQSASLVRIEVIPGEFLFAAQPFFRTDGRSSTLMRRGFTPPLESGCTQIQPIAETKVFDNFRDC